MDTKYLFKRHNTYWVKVAVPLALRKELGFDHKTPLIIYAPAGKYSYPFKQGATLSRVVIKKLLHDFLATILGMW